MVRRIVVLAAGLLEARTRAALSCVRARAAKRDCCVALYACKARCEAGNAHDAGEYMVFDLPDLARYDEIIIAEDTIASPDALQKLKQRAAASGRPTTLLGRRAAARSVEEDAGDGALLERIDDISVDLTMASTFEALSAVLEKHVATLSCEAFYAVLFTRVLAQETAEAEGDAADTPAHAGGRERGSILYAYERGKDAPVFGADAEASLWRRVEEGEMGGCCVVSPLHFGNALFGYTVMRGSELPFTSGLYYTLITAVGNAVQTVKDRRQKARMLQRLEELWGVDALTGVYNRAGFGRYGARVWLDSIERKTGAMLLFADLDRLKAVNDAFGHDEGDRYIRAMADILRSSRRHGEVVMRYGGDEFVVIAGDATEAYAKAYVRDIENRIAMFNESSGKPAPLSASVGYILLAPKPGDTLEDAIFRADKEMYHCKRERLTTPHRS